MLPKSYTTRDKRSASLNPTEDVEMGSRSAQHDDMGVLTVRHHPQEMCVYAIRHQFVLPSWYSYAQGQLPDNCGSGEHPPDESECLWVTTNTP